MIVIIFSLILEGLPKFVLLFFSEPVGGGRGERVVRLLSNIQPNFQQYLQIILRVRLNFLKLGKYIFFL